MEPDFHFLAVQTCFQLILILNDGLANSVLVGVVPKGSPTRTQNIKLLYYYNLTKNDNLIL